MSAGRSRSRRRVTTVIGAVVFDVGECLVNATREYGTWADWLGVPRHTFSYDTACIGHRDQPVSRRSAQWSRRQGKRNDTTLCRIGPYLIEAAPAAPLAPTDQSGSSGYAGGATR
jgi:hypothetical protein